MNGYKLTGTLVGLAITLMVTSGCRDSKRGVRVGGDAATLNMTVTYPAYDLDSTGWVYELSGCEGVPTINGTPAEDNTNITFKSVGLKPGLTCQLRVKDLAADPSMIAFSSGEDKVLFWTNSVLLSQDQNGQLKASANVQQMFNAVPQPGVAKFTIEVPVAFPAKVEQPKIVGTLTCSPKIFNTADFPADADANGTFTFLAPLGEASEYSCNRISVAAYDSANSEKPIQYFEGSIPEAHQKIKASDGAKITLPEPIVMKAVTNGNGGGGGPGGPGNGGGPGGPGSGGGETENVIINASPEDCTGENDIYDIEEHKCYKNGRPAEGED